MGLKENLKNLMELKGENPHSLSTKCQVTQPTIFRILSGESIDPRRTNVVKLAKFFGVTPEDLYGRPNPVPEANQDQKIYALEKRTTLDVTKEERALLDGFRVADDRDREQMLWLANRALDVFDKRSETK